MTESRREKKPQEKLRLKALVLALALSFCISVSGPALAQCEPASDTGGPLSGLIASIVDDLNRFILQEANPALTGANGTPCGFVDNLLKTSYSIVTQYVLDTYHDIEAVLNDWAGKGLTQGADGLQSM